MLCQLGLQSIVFIMELGGLPVKSLVLCCELQYLGLKSEVLLLGVVSPFNCLKYPLEHA